MSEPTTAAGRALHKVDHGDPCPFRTCALVPAILAIENEAAASAATDEYREGVRLRHELGQQVAPLRAALIRHRDLVHEEREHRGSADDCKWHACVIANRALAATEDKP